MQDEESRLVAARYLAGLLSPADAQRFEQSVKDDPALLERMGLGEQIARGSRLVDVDQLGIKPPWWHDRRIAIGAAAALGILVIASTWLAISAGIARERISRSAGDGIGTLGCPPRLPGPRLAGRSGCPTADDSGRAAARQGRAGRGRPRSPERPSAARAR